MPCSDVSEILSLKLGADNHVVTYRLTKQTCGGHLGMPSLIKKWAIQRSADDILSTDYSDFLKQQPIRTVTGELVHLKHLFAIQKGLSALLGRTGSGPDDACALESVEYGQDGSIQMTAVIRLDIITEEIKACTGCGTCGSKMG